MLNLGDKLPPVVTLNKGLTVYQSQSSFLTTNEFDVRDDDTNSKSLRFLVVSQPKLGRLENANTPGKRLDSFTYEDLTAKRIMYTHDEQEFAKSNSIFDEPFRSLAHKDDWADLTVSDGKNEASAVLKIFIRRSDNQIPVLTSTFSVRCRELQRKQIGPSEIKISDADTPDDQLKVIVTHPTQYGTLERMVPNSQQVAGGSSEKIEDKLISINTNTNQKLNLILKFTTNNNNNNNNNTVENKPATFTTINEFTMADLNAGLIYYNHRSPGQRQDRFGFVVYDGVNSIFLNESGQQVSDYQVFNILIETDKNSPPVIEKNNGLDYLYQIETQPGRLIMKNDLLITDEDNPENDVFIEITRKPVHGFIEHRDQRGLPVYRFTQSDINSNKIYYMLTRQEEGVGDVYEDSFEFDVRDSSANLLRGNRFQIKWSALNFEARELSVMESEGKVC